VSRPPRFRTAYSTTGQPLPGQRVLDYLPDEFADFVDTERSLATTELGFPPSTGEGDFAGTLMELSALVAHVLGAYQDRYANDAFLGTARSPKSLVRHGRRLAYEPGPGLAATGHALLTVKEGLSGTVIHGLAIGSAPAGEKKAQDYETLEDLAVDAAWAEMSPQGAFSDIVFAGSSFSVEGTGFGIEAGELVVIEMSSGELLPLEVAEAPTEELGRTRLVVKQTLSEPDFAGAILWAKPERDVHLFGWDTSAASFTEVELQGGEYVADADPVANGDVASGYVVAPSHHGNDLYLAEELKTDFTGTPVVRVGADALDPTVVLAAYEISASTTKAVTFKKVRRIIVTVPNPTPPGGTTKVLDELPTVSVARSVTALRATDGDSEITRASQAIRTSRWLLGFAVTASLVTTEPNPEIVTSPDQTPVVLDREVPGLEPGRLVALAQRGKGASGRFEIVRLTSVRTLVGEKENLTTVQWEPVDPLEPVATWTLGELLLLGNVARISHGKTSSEVLGDSDGKTPFLRFALKQKPLTYLPTKAGAEPALEVRVAQVLWSHVTDFESSSRNDRHYLVQRDENGTATVVFGDGQKGAIPASGKKHISATYRTGIGPDGNSPPFAVSRMKKAHPLLERAENLLPVSGGAAPAQPEDVRTQATGFIRTFDRAVSVPDHKQLALLFPGIAKTNAVWTSLPDGAEGVLVIVADERGGASTVAAVKAFLQERRDDTVPLHVQGPKLVGLHISLRLEIDPAYLEETVERAVRDTLSGTSEAAPGLFTFAARDLGQPAFLSQVYERIEAAPGVRFIEVVRFDTLEEVMMPTPPRVVDTMVAHADELFVLAPQDILFVPAEAP
jgi:hypothetical protein